MGMWMSLRAYLRDRGLVKDLGFLVGTSKLSSQCEQPWSQCSDSNPMHFPPESLSMCQGSGERVVRTDELVRGPGRGSAGRTGLPGRESPPEEGSGCGDMRSPSANKQVRTGESITASLVTPTQLLLSAGLAFLLTYDGEWGVWKRPKQWDTCQGRAFPRLQTASCCFLSILGTSLS